jgi:hypothetical protein
MRRDNIETIKTLASIPGFWMCIIVSFIPLLGPLLKWLEG